MGVLRAGGTYHPQADFASLEKKPRGGAAPAIPGCAGADPIDAGGAGPAAHLASGRDELRQVCSTDPKRVGELTQGGPPRGVAAPLQFPDGSRADACLLREVRPGPALRL